MFTFDSSYYSDIDSTTRAPPPDRPPSPPKKNESTPAKSEFQATNEAVIKALTTSSDIKLKPIQTGGGHGGFYLATVTINNSQGVDETKNLFLKPFDEAEFNNFYFIQKRCERREDTSILKYMPRVYGEATIEVEAGKETQFMVMASLISTDDNKKWDQVADLKMTAGGQYHNAELDATNRDKSLLTRGLLSLQANRSKDFIAVEKSKIKRTFNAVLKKNEAVFTDSLKNALKNIPEIHQKEMLDNLIDQLSELSKFVKDKSSPMGFIGASIFIFASKNDPETKDFKVYLADPAHGLAEPSGIGIPELSDKQRETMYWGEFTTARENNLQFAEKKGENSEAIDAMTQIVKKLRNSFPETHVQIGPPEIKGRPRQTAPPPLPELPPEGLVIPAGSPRTPSPSPRGSPPTPSPRLNTSTTPSPKSAPTSIPTSTGTSRSPSPTPSPRKSPSPPKEEASPTRTWSRSTEPTKEAKITAKVLDEKARSKSPQPTEDKQ